MEIEAGSAETQVFLHNCVQLKVIAGNINEIQAWAALIKVRKHTHTHASQRSEESIPSMKNRPKLQNQYLWSAEINCDGTKTHFCLKRCGSGRGCTTETAVTALNATQVSLTGSFSRRQK